MNLTPEEVRDMVRRCEALARAPLSPPDHNFTTEFDGIAVLRPCSWRVKMIEPAAREEAAVYC